MSKGKWTKESRQRHNIGKELATEQFKMRITPERKKMLDFLAAHDGRSKAKMIDRLILEKFNQVKGIANDN